MQIKKVINNVKAVVAGAGTVVAETFDRLFDDQDAINCRVECRM